MATVPPLTVFFVDDDPDVRFVAARYLTKAFSNIRILEFATAELALLKLDQEVPDAIVTDYILPQMRGIELVKVIRSRWPNLPIVMMSGFETIAHEAAIAGANLFLPPSKIGELGTVLHQLLQAEKTNLRLDTPPSVERARLSNESRFAVVSEPKIGG